ncbi:MAG: family 10 glycosylhydrolase [Clostridia bacterium]|nr:family 10 glycosylhydrolase [Clostridia bacterium]
MKRIFCFVLCLCFVFLSSCSEGEETAEKSEEIRAVWISIYDMAEFKGMSEGGFRAKCENMFKDIFERGLKYVFVQVRPSGDALYKSEIFPWSKYISGEQGVSPGYDPLEIFLKTAHSYGLKLHAWINPYRVSSTSSDMEKLSETNPARRMYNNNPRDVYLSTEGIYYNPASEKVQKLILDGVRELVKNYDIDGVHIDDFFYPTTDEEIDKNEYADYKENSGKDSLDIWRRNQVNAFVSGMYSAVKSEKENVIVSISPSADIVADINVHYADVALWCSEKGYCDWIIPQIYYGFDNEYLPYKKTVNQWKKLVTNENIKLVIGLASYKCGAEDLYAGNGKDEWQKNDNILCEQLKYLRKKECDGFSLFSYNSLAIPNATMKAEWENFKAEFISVS